jgi:hypothetical protein
MLGCNLDHFVNCFHFESRLRLDQVVRLLGTMKSVMCPSFSKIGQIWFEELEIKSFGCYHDILRIILKVDSKQWSAQSIQNEEISYLFNFEEWQVKCMLPALKFKVDCESSEWLAQSIQNNKVSYLSSSID